MDLFHRASIGHAGSSGNLPSCPERQESVLREAASSQQQALHLQPLRSQSQAEGDRSRTEESDTAPTGFIELVRAGSPASEPSLRDEP